LIVIDEAPGVAAEIWQAIEGIGAGGQVHILALGNPTSAGGPFHAAVTTERELWHTFTIDAFDTPNFVGLTLDDLAAYREDFPSLRRSFKHRHGPIW
jgi:hypothetical protein